MKSKLSNHSHNYDSRISQQPLPLANKIVEYELRKNNDHYQQLLIKSK